MAKTIERDILSAGESTSTSSPKSITKAGAEALEGLAKLKDEYFEILDSTAPVEKRYDLLLTYTKILLNKIDLYINLLK